MRKKSLSMVILTILMFSIISGIPFLYASNTHYTEDISTSSVLDTKYVELSDGRAVYSWVDSGATSYIRFKLLNSTGGDDGSANFQRSASYTFSDVSLHYINDTCVLAFYIYKYLNTVDYFKVGILKFNPSTLSVSDYDESAGVSLDASTLTITSAFISTIIPYDGDFYAMVNFCIQYTGPVYYVRTGIIKWNDYTTATYESLKNSVGNAISPIHWFYEGAALAYAMYSNPTHTGGVYKVSLSAQTSIYLCSDPDPTYFPDAVNAQFSHFLRGDVEVSGTNLYLYFSYVASTYSGSLQLIRIKQVRYIFTGSIVDTNLTATDNIKSSITLNLNSYSAPLWVVGISTARNLILIWYPDLTDGLILLFKTKFEITGDWFSTSAGWSPVTTTPATEAVPVVDPPNYPLSMSFITQWGMSKDSTTTLAYYNLVQFGAGTYSIRTLLTPVENPCYTNKAYILTVTGEVGGTGRGGLAFWLTINSQAPALYGMSSLGIRNLSLTFQNAGVTNITASLVDARIDTTTLRDTENKNYTVVTGVVNELLPSNVTGGFFSGTGVSIIVNFVPLFAVVVGPAIAFSAFGGVGMVLGLGVGALLGVMTGIIPFYVVFILLLLIAIGLVMVFRGGMSASGTKGEG